MQIQIQAKCSLSPTGSHTVTLTYGMSGGRAGSQNSIVNISAPCRADDPMVDVARATDEPVCCDVQSAFLDALDSDDSGYYLSERFTEALTAGSAESGVIELLGTALGRGVTGAKQTRERRARNELVLRTSDPAWQPVWLDRSRRWDRVVDGRLALLGMKYSVSLTEGWLDHTGAGGLAVRFRTGAGGGAMAIFAPTGSNRVHVYRESSRGIVGRVITNPDSGKAYWCQACGCAVRGMERHAVSVGHKAVVRRDVFRLAKALFPNRIVRELTEGQPRIRMPGEAPNAG